MSNYPKNFSRAEMLHSDTGTRLGIENKPENEAIENNLLTTANFLQSLRDKILEETGKERSIHVLSCYRCPKLNKAVGGSKTSAHMVALAADIRADGMTVRELAEFIIANFDHFDQIIDEFDSWVHVGVATKESCRKQVLSARKVNGKTKYLSGLV